MKINIIRKNLKRTRIIVHINNDLSLNVSIGPNVTKHELDKFLNENQSKIQDLIKKREDRNNLLENLANNGKILYFGSWLPYIITKNNEKSSKNNMIFLSKDYFSLSHNEIIIKLYSELSEKYFPTYIKEIENLTNIKCKKYTFTKTISRWGSFNTKDYLRLSIFLCACPVDTIKYVICHELCHKIHMNHSKSFHSLLNKYYNSEIHDPILNSTGKYVRSLKCK